MSLNVMLLPSGTEWAVDLDAFARAAQDSAGRTPT